ncbi:MAG TPA: wax ester/triacylglycerol synthase family O-acyltransferase [Dehalococcoidia bacterium]|nr:wax ester/triacylglycerol synthase family O-acyltransferase [Dehalococcoidia bacterium]
MTTGTLARRMSAEDAWFLYFEKPDAPLHIGSVGIYEGTVDFDRFYASMEGRMHLIPRYRQRAVIPPFYAGHPTWEDDPAFSLGRHLRLVKLPAPGSIQQLKELSAAIFAEMLPRDRPLWDITVVHGVEGDRTAYISRVHHCLVDGVSGIELLLAVLDLVPNPEPTPPPSEPWRPVPPPDPLTAWADALFEQWANGLRSWTEWQQSLLDPREQLRQAAELTRAIETALPAALRRPTATPWNKPIGPRRAMAWSGMPFQEVRGIRSSLGGTVNDVMLTIIGGALGRYLDAHGVPTKDRTVRIMIPVNVRKSDEKGALGNRVSMMLPEIPVGIDDPARRLDAVREEMERLKSRNQSAAFEHLTRLTENMPAVFHALAGINGVPPGGANLVCTNVPGPMIPLWSVGHRLLEHWPMVPLAGDLGIGVGITSFDKGLFVGVMADPDIVPDVDVIGRYCDEEFRRLREAAGVTESDLPDVGLPRNGVNGAGKASSTVAAAAAAPAAAPA